MSAAGRPRAGKAKVIAASRALKISIRIDTGIETQAMSGQFS